MGWYNLPFQQGPRLSDDRIHDEGDCVYRSSVEDADSSYPLSFVLGALDGGKAAKRPLRKRLFHASV